jgi:hypothetical protein
MVEMRLADAAGSRGRGRLIRILTCALLAACIGWLGAPVSAFAAGTLSFASARGFHTGSGPQSVAIGDLNGDGKPDMVTANTIASDISVLLGSGDGQFEPATDFLGGTYPYSVAIGDLNGDGKPDLVTANFGPSDGSGGDVTVLLGDGTGSFGSPTHFAIGAITPLCVAIADLNGDGKLDVVTANLFANNVSVMLGDGTGALGAGSTFATGRGADSVAIGDVNGDGKPDLAVANYDADTVSILLGNGSGGFGAPSNINVGAGPTSIVLRDFNGDGKLDFAESNDLSSNVCVIFGDGSGGVGGGAAYAVGTNPYSIVAGDLDGDGNTDLATAGLSSNDASVLLGDGAGGFGTAVAFPAGLNPAGIAMGDVDSDGRPDLVTANYSASGVALLLNTTPNKPTVLIDGGAAFTTTTTVELSFTTTGAVADVILANDAAFTGSSWQSYTETSTWTLDSGDGVKTVYAQFRNGAGGVSEVCSDTIALDTIPPVAVDDTASVAADTVLTVDAPGVLANDSGTYPITAAQEMPPASGSLTLNPDGSYQYTPDTGFRGFMTFTYRATDGCLASEPATVTIAVFPATPHVLIDAGAAAATTTAVTLSFDPTGTPVDVMLANDAAFTGSSWKSYTETSGWTIDAGQGEKAVYAQYRDAAGTVSEVCSDTIFLETTPPVAVDDTAKTEPGTTLLIDPAGVLGNDVSSNFPISAVLDTPPANGEITLRADGSYDYAPYAAFRGVDTFKYRATDGWLTSEPATVTVSVFFYAPHVVIDDAAAYTTTTSVTLSLGATGTVQDVLLGNDAAFTGSVWHSYTDTCTWTLASGAGMRTVYAQYRDSAGTVSDVSSDDIALDTIPPVAVNDSASTPQDTVLTVDAPGVLTNDIHPTFPITAVSPTRPPHGQITLSSDGYYQYTPDSGFHGTDTFTYRATDGWLTSAPATVTITVVAPAPPPDTTPPGPVTGLTARAGDRQVVLAWVNPASDFAATRILRSSAGYATTWTAAGQTQVYDGTGASATDLGLTNGTLYYYTAFARDAAGNWSARATASATPMAPPLTKASLSLPRLSPTSPTRSRYFTVSGTVSAHAGLRASVYVYFYRKVGSRWRYYRRVLARTATGSASYRLKYRLPYRGRWYLKVYHKDANHLASWSRLRYFAVR